MERRTLCAALLALLLLALCPAALAEGSWADEGNYDTSWYSDAETVFHIKTPEQLAGLMNLLPTYWKQIQNQIFYLNADLDMGAHEWFCQMIWPFMGTFDGLGHTIRGLHMDVWHERMGLFGRLQGATVQNLSIVNASFTSTEGGGGFGLLAAAAYEHTLIRNCTTSGSITVNKKSGRPECRVGGLVGYADGLTVQACASSAQLKCDSEHSIIMYSTDYMGGIIGYSDWYGVTVQDCLFSGTIESSKNTTHGYIGGMVGWVVPDSDQTKISNCLMLGLMKGTPGNGGSIDFNRIAIHDTVHITDCYYVERDGEGEQGTGGSLSGYLKIPNNGATKKTTDDIKKPGFLETLNGKVSSDVVWTAGTDGKPKPGFELADYAEVDAAIDEAKALNRDDYLDLSGVDAALKAVVRDLRIFDRDKVRQMAKDIEDAIAALKYKPADYSAVDKAMAKAKALRKTDYVDFSGVEAALKAVVRGKKIIEQAEVDAMAQAIEAAIAALTLPQTGDTGRLPLWAALTLGSLLALAAVTGRRDTRA